MSTSLKSRNPHLMDSIGKYWYLCVLYLFFSYALTQILVLGSSKLAASTDSLFAGETLILKEFMLPFILLMLLGGVAAFGKSYSKNTFSICMQTDMRNRLVSKLVKIRTRYFDDEGTGVLINKLLSDIQQIETLFTECIPEFLVAIITIVTVCTYIGMQSIRLLLVTIVCYPLLLWIANKLSRMVGKIATVRRQLYDDLENSTYDVIQGILVGKTFNLYQLHKKRIFTIIDAIVQNEAHRTRILAVNYVMGEIVRWIPKLICYLFCLYEVHHGRMSIGMIFAYVMLLDQVARPMGNIPGQIASIRECRISTKRLQEVLNQEEELCGTGNFAPEGDVVIELEHVKFGYSEEKQVLRDISLTIRKGSNVAFIGESGSGKSTVMKILCGFYYPQEGQYRLYGHNFSEWDINALRKHIGLVSQNVFLFSGSIYLIAMLLLSWQVSLCLFGASFVLFLINGLFIGPMQRVSRQMSLTNVSITERISNILSGMELIKIFSLKSIMVDRYIEDNEKFRREQNKMNLMSAKLDGLNQLFELLGSLVFIALGLVFVSQGITSVQNLAAVYLLYGSMSWNLLQLGLYIPSMASYLANAKRVFAFLELEEEPERYGNSTNISVPTDAEISICNVIFSYDGKQNILEHFYLDIPKEKCVALKAESGKGKSTLTKLMLGLYPVKEGTIFIKGRPFSEYSLEEVRQLIGYVPQEPYLYDVTIAENIRYGRPDASMEDIVQAAKLANAHDFIMKLENGYENRAGERGNLLSGGQRQRIAIARAILKDASILILDEATSALDNKSEAAVNEALGRLMKGRTTIVIAHRESTLAHADLVVEL